MTESMAPVFPFRFEVTFREDALPPGDGGGGTPDLCRGSFSECSGLEATMEAKEINEGGRNYGVAQRAGRVTFAPVVFRRGVTTNTDLWQWFSLVARGGYAYRLTATITLWGPGPDRAIIRQIRLRHCIPTKLKAPDLNASSGEVAIEELHVAHEGLEIGVGESGGQ